MIIPHPQVKILVVTSEMFEENAYILHIAGTASDSSKDCLIIDPGLDAARIIEVVESHDLSPEAIVCTHGHADHIAGNEALKRRWPACPLIIGVGDADKLTDPVGNMSAGFGVNLISPPADQTTTGGDQHTWGGVSWTVVDTPGHSSGHIALIARELDPPVVVGGDVLFAGSVGRTDLPDSDPDALVQSIRDHFYSLPDTTVVLPGHGPATTVGVEMRTNPYVRGS